MEKYHKIPGEKTVTFIYGLHEKTHELCQYVGEEGRELEGESRN